MTVSELKREFPGLFDEDACESVAEAERYADSVSAQLNLGMRIASWTGGNHIRVLEYRDPADTIVFRVELAAETNGRSSQVWLFRCSAEQRRSGLEMQSPHRQRVKPSAFQRDAREMIEQLRRVKVDANGRLLSQLKKWDGERGKGVLECVPGAAVLLESEDLPAAARRTVRRFDWFSFEIENTPKGQKAIKVTTACRPEST